MSEERGKEVVKLAERFAEGLPGFALVALALGALLPLSIPAGSERQLAPGEKVKQFLPVIAVVLAYFSYFTGHYLDDWMFDPIWGLPGCLKSEGFLRRFLLVDWLDKQRMGLAKNLKRPETGIFAKAQQLASGTEVWEKKIKWPLEFSKAFRSLVVMDLVALLLWVDAWWIWYVLFCSVAGLFFKAGKSWNAVKYSLFFIVLVCAVLVLPVHYLRDSDSIKIPAPGVLCAILTIFIGLYLVLRIWHLKILYEEAGKIEPREHAGFFCAGRKVVPIRKALLFSNDRDITDTEFQSAEMFVQSEALLHVKLTTARGIGDALRDDKRVQKMYLTQVKQVTKGEYVCSNPRADLSCFSCFDVIIHLVPGNAPDKTNPDDILKLVNGPA